MADFVLKKGDRLPKFSAQLLDASGLPVDLTGYTVQFRMRLTGGSPVKVDAAATVENPASSGLVSYSWVANDVNAAGEYRGEFELTETATGKKQVVPANDYLTISIQENLA